MVGQRDLFGTDPEKLYRKSDPETSEEAAYSIDTTRLEALVYSYIKSRGLAGCISDEVRAAFPDLSYSSVTARFSALIEKRLIERPGERRKGKSGRTQHVMRATVTP